MFKVLLVIHVMIALALIVIVLVQRTSSDGMGLSGSSSSNNFLSGRMAANFMTRATSLLAIAFILTSLGLGIITTRNHNANSSLMEKIQSAPALPGAATPATTTPTQPAATTPEKPAPAPAPAVPRPE
jgi:preprotein translocase subunit SecG